MKSKTSKCEWQIKNIIYQILECPLTLRICFLVAVQGNESMVVSFFKYKKMW